MKSSLQVLLHALLIGAAQAQVPPPVPAPAPAPAPQQLDKVEVTGQSNDDSKRRAATASKIIISRDELLRFGDSNLVDLMRRLPGVTPTGRPGRGGGVSMRGMGGGFTQILVDGERMAPGFSLDQIPPDQIERIEIQRAPTAETGARAVAGTINIVLREPLTRKLNEFRVQLGGDHGEPQFNAAWTRNDSFSPNLNYSLTVAANSRRNADETFSRTDRWLNEALIESRSSESHSLNERLGLNLNGRLQWKLGEGDSLMLMPFVALGDSENRSFTLQTGEPRYTRVDNEGEGRQRMLRLNGQYQTRLAPYTRVDLRFGGGRGQFDSDSVRRQSGGTENRIEEVSSTSRNDNFTANAKLSHQTAAEHNWVSGAEFERGRSDSERIQYTNGQLEVGTGEFGESLSASTRRFAAYTQDEWQATPNWSLHGGLRYEQIESSGNRGDGPVSNTSKVWSPLLHALWKPDPKSRDQVRMSLTRSYRPASLNDLLARRVTNSQVPTGPNTEDRADRAGNAELDPELATGLELAYERYLPKGGMLSANLFYRDIKGLIRTVLAQETVLLDGVPTLRWTQRPQNLGNARTWGVELEARGRLDDLIDDLPAALVPLQLRANLSLFDSEVDDIPGPNNRIDSQPRGTFNLGADYRYPSSNWSFGANWSYTPEIVIQQTEILQVRTSQRVVLDAYAQYAQSAALTWRLGLSNMAPRDALGESLISTSSGLTSRTETLNPTYLNWSLRAEMRF
jgi:iron complex outermembrane receptor protein